MGVVYCHSLTGSLFLFQFIIISQDNIREVRFIGRGVVYWEGVVNRMGVVCVILCCTCYYSQREMDSFADNIIWIFEQNKNDARFVHTHNYYSVCTFIINTVIHLHV